MAKHKLARFAENRTFTNLFQHDNYDLQKSSFPLKGNWQKHYFKNENPIVLELGCGKGEYTIAMSQAYPDKNFIGIDRKGARLWRGAKTAFERQMMNVAFLRIGIENIADFFAASEIDEIWITFPDPQPKKERRRLTSPQYIERYKQLISDEATINLKTDSRELYQYTLETAIALHWKIIETIEDVYLQSSDLLLTTIQTFYEQRWVKEGKMISFIKFNVNQ
ncbi:MAG: tRNA (guanosine(46)-N7)-methyltransferase TrmB [Bacteroidales bacterium]|jgi:tRNA (guanine-N7-)-methyltransferase|nr:tRNA (guanosine(46)-N7)-methyltransferase TrmB [Bacteroidales bacterium]